jgi:hypothetical protein
LRRERFEFGDGSEQAAKTIRHYLNALLLIQRRWESQIRRTPSLDGFTLKNAEAGRADRLASGIRIA